MRITSITDFQESKFYGVTMSYNLHESADNTSLYMVFADIPVSSSESLAALSRGRLIHEGLL